MKKQQLLRLYNTKPKDPKIKSYSTYYSRKQEGTTMEGGEPEATPKKMGVMIAIDECECSFYAVEWAIANLKPAITSDAGVLLFTVLSSDYGGAIISGIPDLITSMQENQKKVAISLLEKAKELCAKNGVHEVEIAYEFGHPKETICEAVDKYHVQLLVIGSHSKGAIQRAFLGSVSNYCVNHAKCPVLVVRRPTS